jgi:diguanylate cyclase (GGDEF)-like protein
MNGQRPARLLSGETLRLLPVLAPVAVGGGAALAAAVVAYSTDSPSWSAVAGVFALATCSALAEAFPVPVAAFASGTISLSAVFIVASGVVYGWQAAVITGFLARSSVDLVQRRPLRKVVFNGGLYALSGLAAGVTAPLGLDVGGVGGLFLGVFAGSAAFALVNIPLVVAIVARASRTPFLPALRGWVGWTAASFGVMASLSLMLSALWQRSPALAVALVGPVAATALYQRSLNQALGAMQLALTDPLTGLGNHRHFHDDIQRALDDADGDEPVSLLLLDLDDFKHINDTHGHPAGDDVLAAAAACLRAGGEAYRLGGDEFALLLPGCDTVEASGVADTVLEQLAGLECADGVRVTFSGGLATFPRHAAERSELLRVADVALYSAKRSGKNRLRVADTGAPRHVAVLAS